MTRYNFYIVKKKLICEYMDKYNKLYVLENNEAINRLAKVSNYKYNKIELVDEDANFYSSYSKVTIESYAKTLKIYRSERLTFLINKEIILNKLSKLVKPSKIFIFYVPAILLGIKLLNLPEEPKLYGEGIDIRKELGEPIDINELEIDNSNEKEKEVNDDIVEEVNQIFDADFSYINSYDIDIDCYEKGESEDTKYVIEKYGDIIDELSNKYGFSSNLIVGIITQESHGVHENLMQVIFNLNDDYISRRYNFETNKYETIVLTNSPEEYPDVDVVITEEMMKTPYYAILAGINAFRINFDEYSGNNLILALETQNKGCGNMMKILQETSKNTGVSIENIMYDPSNLSYLFFDNLGVGDKLYSEHVIQYIPNALTDGIYVKTIDKEGNIGMIKLYVNKTLGKVKNK